MNPVANGIVRRFEMMLSIVLVWRRVEEVAKAPGKSGV
jgi:hypothetical protein